MITGIKSSALLTGARGQKPRDINAVKDTILKVGTILKECPRITDIEVNPIVVYEEGKGLKAVDSRIMIAAKLRSVAFLSGLFTSAAISKMPI
jgi:acyl-CoA synthetase (NDP forming)